MKTSQNVYSCRKLSTARTVAMLFALLLATTLAFSACSGEGGGLGSGLGIGQVDGIEPVYTGMTVGDSPEASAAMLPENVLLSLGKSDVPLSQNENGDISEQDSEDSVDTPETDSENGETGHVSGDIPGGKADQNDPFDQLPDGDAEAGSNNHDILIEEARDLLQLQDSANPIYHAQKKQNIYITVHIDNPDGFEILSFTLNGKKYSSYMFESGSNPRSVVVKVNVGNAEGVQEYTIDEIKYVNGSAIKDVRMEGDKTVRVGVCSDKQPRPIISNEVINFNDVSFDAAISDTLSLIPQSEGYAVAVLYDGETILDTQPLTLDETTKVSFTGLSTNTLYQYAILAYYDALDGTGMNVYVLRSKAFYTRAILLFDNVTLNSESLEYEFAWAKDAPEKTVTALELESATEGTVTLDAAATSISGLHSNTEYKLTASYRNGSSTETVSITFTTAKKKAPSVTLTETEVSYSDVGFSLQINDPDSVATLASIELISDKTGVTYLPLDATSASGLLSDTAYTIRVTYVYDLNDGDGVHEVQTEIHVQTPAKTIPYFLLSTDNPGQEEFTFDLTSHDPDGIATLTRLEVINDKTGSLDLPLDNRNPKGLLSNTYYFIKATFTYDLNDGTGIHEESVFATATTLPKTKPSLTLSQTSIGQSDFTFDVNLIDRDGVATLSRITLLCAKTGERVEIPVDARSIDNLLTNTAYVLEVFYTYDLNDNSGVRTASTKLNINTEPKQIPSLTLTKGTADQDSFSFALSINDPDAVATLTRIELLSAKTESIDVALDAKEINGLLSDTSYTLRAWYTYDLGDGTGVHETSANIFFKTLAKKAPTYTVTEQSKEHDVFTVTTSENDPDNVGQITDLSVYLNGELIASADTFDTATFRDLTSNRNYQVVLTYEYDLNDGNGVITKTVTTYVLTKVYFVPVNVINQTQGDVSEGEYIYIDINVLNPGDAAVESVRINGKDYKVSSTSTSETVRVAIKHEYQFEGGWTNFTVESLTASANGETHVYSLSENNVVSVFIDGKLEVKNFAITDSAGVPVEYAFPSDTVAFYVSLYDKTGYRIDSVTVRYYYDTWSWSETVYYNDQIVVLDNNTIMIPITDRQSGIRDYEIIRVEYSNPNPESDFSKSINVTTSKQTLMCFDVDEIIYVSTPEDLRNMNHWAYYELTGDIDLSQAGNWTNSNDFYGYFDGKGYSIRGMNIRSSYSNQSISIGLFNNVSGQIVDLNVTDVLVTATISNTNGGRFSVLYGAIGTYVDQRIILNNVHVSQLVDIQTEGTTPDCSVGLLIPSCYSYLCYVTDSVTVSGSVTLNDQIIVEETLGQSASDLPQPPVFDGDSAPDAYRVTVDYVTGLEMELPGNQTILIGNLPTLPRDGYLFCGWYDNAEFTGSPVQSDTRPEQSLTLYAKWLDIGMTETSGLETVDGVITGIGTCTDSVLYINGPIEANAFNGCSQITVVYLGSKTQFKGTPFNNCQNLEFIVVSGAIPNAENLNFANWGLNAQILTDKAPDPDTQSNSRIYNFERLITKDGVTYICLNDGTAIAFSFDDSTTHVTIGLDDYVVTEIVANMFYNCQTLQSVVISDGVVKIGNNAFDSCFNLAEIVLPDTLTHIGSYAFSSCNALTELTLPGSLTHIGDLAFCNCYGLETLILSEGIVSIGQSAFSSCSKLQNVTLPSTLTQIGRNAFYNCNALQSIVIPEGVTKIDTSAFQDCYALKYVTLPSTLLEIGEFAFNNINTLYLAIPQSVTSIGRQAFNKGKIYLYTDSVNADWHSGWNSDREDTLVFNFEAFYTDAQGVTYALFQDKTAIAIAYEGDTSTLILDVEDYSLTEITDGLFAQADWIESVTIANTVTRIGHYAFDSCGALTELILPESLTEIGNHAFDNCDSLEELNLPESLTIIGDNAFVDCDSLTKLVLPESLTAIGDYAFNNCDSLTEVFIPGSVTSWGVYTFAYCDSLTNVVIGEGISKISDSTFFECNSLQSLTLPSTLTEIGSHAFYSCYGLKDIVIPEGVTKINDYAFAYCHYVETITLPSTLTEIGRYAFYNYYYLQHVEIPEGVVTIGEYAFNNGIFYVHTTSQPENWAVNWNGDNRSEYAVYNFKQFYTDEQGILYALFNDDTAHVIDFNGEATDIVIGVDGYTVTTIKNQVFSDQYDLRSVVIPEGVTKIESGAFQGCSGLYAVSLPGTLTEVCERAFNNVSNQLVIHIPDALTTVGSYAFNGPRLFCSAAQAPDGWAYDWCGYNSNSVTWNIADLCTDEYGVIYVRLNDGTVSIAGVNGIVSEIVLGGNADFPVTEIPESLISGRTEFTVITIDPSITTIGAYAFNGTYAHIIIPKTVTSIGSYAFHGAFAYTSAAIKPSTWSTNWNGNNNRQVLWSAPAGTFYTAEDGMTYLLLSDGTAHLYFFKNSDSEELFISGVEGCKTVIHSTTNRNGSTGSNSSVTKLVIGEGVVKLDDYAFHDWYNVKEVVLPSTLKEIGAYAFNYCNSLATLTLPDTLEKIGAYAFQNVALDELMIPATVLTINENAFGQGAMLITVAQKPDGWHQNWYSGEQSKVFWDFKEFLTDENGITYVLTNSDIAYVYSYEEGATEITIGAIEGYNVIVRPAFRYDQNLVKVTLLDTVTRIDAQAFSNCSSLKEITLSSCLTYIGESAFYDTGCHIILPDSVTEIGASAFHGCCVYVSASERLSGWNSNWIGSSGAVVYNAPNGTLSTDEKGFTYLIDENGIAHLYYYTVNNSDITISGLAGYETVIHSMKRDIWNVNRLTIGEGVVKIDDYAFQNWYNLNEISLPSTLTEIGAYAFANTALQNAFVIVSANVTSVGEYAFSSGYLLVEHAQKPEGWSDDWFSGDQNKLYWNYQTLYADSHGILYVLTHDQIAYVCKYDSNLSSVTIGAIEGDYQVIVRRVFYSNSHINTVTLLEGVTKIEESAFENFYSLQTLTLPSTLTEIGARAFCGAPLNKPTIPKNVQIIGENAFSCNSVYPLVSSKPEGWHENWYTQSSSNIYWDLLEMITDDTTGITYIVHYDGTASIYKYDGTVTNLVIQGPNGCVVTDIYPQVFSGSSIESIVLPEGLTHIGKEAFKYCYNLTEISLPSTLKEIGNYAFYNCTALTNLTLPEGIVHIGAYAFSNCHGLDQITLPTTLEKLDDHAFSNCQYLQSATVNGTNLTVSNDAFRNCTALQSLTLTDGIVAIGDNAFNSCYNLAEIVLPETLTHIGNGAFRDCDALTQIVIPESTLTIGDGAFYDCNGLEQITLPNGLTEIGAEAFWSCSALTEIYIPGSVTEIGANTFGYCSNLETVVIGEGVTKIGQNAFTYCGALRELTLPSTLREIDHQAFYYADSLTNLVIPEGVTTIGTWAFAYCSSLKSITLPETLETIGECAFRGASTNNVIIPASVTYIGEYAFTQGTVYLRAPEIPATWEQYWNGEYREAFAVCNVSEMFTDEQGVTYAIFNDGNATVIGYEGDASEIVIESNDRFTVTHVAPNVFSGNNTLVSVVLGDGLTTIGEGAFSNCQYLEQITLPSTLTSIGARAFQYCYALTSIEIPEGVTVIPDQAFYNCNALEQITLPSTLTVIGAQAFEYCYALTTIDFPESLTQIDDRAFGDCDGLTSIVLPDSVTQMGYGVFGHCSNLVDVTLSASLTVIGAHTFEYCNALQSISIPEGVTKIGENAFFDCYNLRSVSLPSSLTQIGAYAFYETRMPFTEIPANVSVIGTYAFNHGTIYAHAESQPAQWDANWNTDYRQDKVVWNIAGLYTDAQGVTYALCNDGTATVIHYSGNQERVELYMEGYTITAIDPYVFSGQSTLKSIVIPEGVTVIRNNAFYNCYSLCHVELPSTLTEIGEYAFYDVSDYAVFHIPENVTSIGTYAFNRGMVFCNQDSLPTDWASGWNSYNSNLVTRNVSDVLTDAYGVTYVKLNDGTSYIARVNGLCSEIVLGGADGFSVTEIPARLLQCQSGITKVTVHPDITSIGEYAFNFCYDLEIVELPEGLQHIGEYAFSDSNAHVRIPSSVTEIDYAAFNCCYAYIPFDSTEIPEGWHSSWCGTNVVWNAPDGTFCLSDEGNVYLLDTDGIAHLYFYEIAEGELTIHALDDYPTVVYGNHYYNWNVTALVIDEGVIKLSDKAFYCWYALREVTLPSTLTEIGAEAFYGCNNLVMPTLSEKLDTIGAYAFYNVQLKEYTVPSTITTIGESAFNLGSVLMPDAQKPEGWHDNWYGGDQRNVYWDFKQFLTTENGITYAITNSGIAYVYAYEGDATEIEIGLDGYQTVVRSVFKDNTALQKVTLLEGVVEIDALAFQSCSSLTEVVLPTTLKTIGDQAFDGCSSLSTFVLPDGLESIGSNAFNNIAEDVHVIIPESVTYVATYAFNGSYLYVVSSSHMAEWSSDWHAYYTDRTVTDVPAGTLCTAENGNTYLVDADGVAHLYFYKGNDTEITISGVDGCDVIIHGTGNTNSNGTVEKLIIGEGVTKLDAYAFYYWYNLKEVVLPSTLTEIGAHAFDYCYSLTDVNLPYKLTTIGEKAFYNVPLEDPKIPASVTTVGQYAFTCSKIYPMASSKPEGWHTEWFSGSQDNVFWDLSEIFYDETNGITYLIHTDGTASVYQFDGSVTEVVIGLEDYPVTDIYPGVFANSSITAVVLPDTLTTIGDYAFDRCYSLTTVTWSNSLTYIGAGAFNSCSILNQIELPDSVTYIGNSAFYDCYNAQMSKLPGALISIGRYAFHNVSFTDTLIVPESVTAIGENALHGNVLVCVASKPEGWSDSWHNGNTSDVTWNVKEVYEDATYGVTYILFHDQTAIVRDFDNRHTNVVILSEINGCTVIGIGEGAFCASEEIESIELPDSLLYIGKEAFYGCHYLKQINLPSNLQEIGEYAFYNCCSLSSIIIPEGVTTIGSSAFYNCDGLLSVTLPNTLTSISSRAFADCDQLSSIVIPKGVTKIDSAAFQYCYALTEIILPNSVTEIGSSAFESSGLQNVFIPESVITIGSTAFSSGTIYVCHAVRPENWADDWNSTNRKEYVVWNFDALYTDEQGIVYTLLNDQTAIVADYVGTATEIDMTLEGYTVTAIKDGAFRNCDTLVSIVIPESVTEIGEYAFYDCNALTSVVIPESVTTIGNYAFYACDGLTSIVIPEGVTTIGENAFAYCYSLTSVIICEGVTEIGNCAFYYCSSLTSLTIPKSVTTIGNSAFRYCKSLTSVIIPEGVTTIGEYAFRSCESLTTVIIPESVTEIGYYAFIECSNRANICVIGKEGPVDWFEGYSDKVIWKFEQFYTDEQGVVYALQNDQTAVVVDCDEETTADIDLTLTGYTVTKIKARAFYGNNLLQSITLPEGVTEIGKYAFFGCSALTNITLPNTLTKIEDYAFQACYDLTSIVIPKSVAMIGNGAFAECSNITIFATASEQPTGWTDGWINNFNLVKWHFDEFYTNEHGVVYALMNDQTAVIVGYEGTATDIDLTLELEGYTVIKITAYAFHNCDTLQSIIIPKGVIEIGNHAFSYCISLTSVVIPESVTEIGTYAFCGCNSLSSVVIPESVTTIGYYAFDRCWNLTIYAIASEQPAGWDSNWNGNGIINVVWGYTPEESQS